MLSVNRFRRAQTYRRPGRQCGRRFGPPPRQHRASEALILDGALWARAPHSNDSPSSALRTISSAGSFGLLRCSTRASVQGTDGFKGPHDEMRRRFGDACVRHDRLCRGPMRQPGLAASTIPRCIGARRNGKCFDNHCITSAWTAPRFMLKHQRLLCRILGCDLLRYALHRRRQDRHPVSPAATCVDFQLRRFDRLTRHQAEVDFVCGSFSPPRRASPYW